MRILAILVILASAAGQAASADYKDDDIVNFMLFGMRALGANATRSDIKQIPSSNDVDIMLRSGLNSNRKMCASVVSVRRLKDSRLYEVICVAVDGGEMRKGYLIDPNTGVADGI
ncbi:MAG: hypothetical protein WAN43_04620 [Rhodomicrobium sp.]|jgi:hypothetical protein